MTPGAVVVLGLVWIAAAAISGGLLALLAKRMHPALSLRRLWLFYTALMAVTAALVLAIGWL